MPSLPLNDPDGRPRKDSPDDPIGAYLDRLANEIVKPEDYPEDATPQEIAHWKHKERNARLEELAVRHGLENFNEISGYYDDLIRRDVSRQLARLIYEEERGTNTAETTDRFVSGAEFILDAPDHVPAIWGAGDEVLWALGEALTLAGPPGVGKTTLTGQVVRARLGLADKVLGYPVAPTVGRMLYLAMDRPEQIRRSLRRTFRPEDRAVLKERLEFWKGPPLHDLARHPEELLRLVRKADADTVFLDFLKDAAIGLSEDEVGAGYNRARQMCLAEGIEIVELHHMVKRNSTGGAPTSLEDMYGSAWIAAGAGSVVLLWGKAGDPIVDLRHLKQPAAEVGPFQVLHDHKAGTSEVWEGTDLAQVASAAGTNGLTAKDAAAVLFSTAKPTVAEIQKARRKLDRLVEAGRLSRNDGDRTRATVWFTADPFTDPITDVI